jgi:DNA-binding MarR family transcriptional regulator
MSTTSRRSAARPALTRDGGANLGGAGARCAPGMLSLDENEPAVRRLWEHVAAGRPAQPPRCMLPLSAARDELGHLLHETARLWRRRCERAVHAQLPGMTCARCAVLLKLEQPGGFNQITLAHSLDIAPITVVRLLDRLETAGLVSRLPDPLNRRSYLLTLTAKAWSLIVNIHDTFRTIESEVWLGLSDTETKQLRALLCRIRSNLLVGANQPLPADPAGCSGHA